MKHPEFANKLRTLLEQASRRYGEGRRGAETFFAADEAAWLAANGITAQHAYDYAEDHSNYGEPGFDTAVAIESVRRDYFLNVQGGKPSPTVIDVTRMPAKTDAVRGIAWLPRLIPKAKAKLRGELPASLMYCCGGDREFFARHNIFAAEFLTLVWRNRDDDAATIEWVLRRASETNA